MEILFFLAAVIAAIWGYFYLKNRPYNQAIDAFVALIESGEIYFARTSSMKGEDKAETAGLFTVASAPGEDPEAPKWSVGNDFSFPTIGKPPAYVRGNAFVFKDQEYDLYFLIANALRRHKNNKAVKVAAERSRAPAGLDGYLETLKA